MYLRIQNWCDTVTHSRNAKIWYNFETTISVTRMYPQIGYNIGMTNFVTKMYPKNLG